MEIEKILSERGEKYASKGYGTVALVAQNIKAAMRHSPNWAKLPADMRESLEMVASKTSRILNGDPTYLDSWVDCVGYLQLVIERLERGHNGGPSVSGEGKEESGVLNDAVDQVRPETEGRTRLTQDAG